MSEYPDPELQEFEKWVSERDKRALDEIDSRRQEDRELSLEILRVLKDIRSILMKEKSK